MKRHINAYLLLLNLICISFITGTSMLKGAEAEAPKALAIAVCFDSYTKHHLSLSFPTERQKPPEPLKPIGKALLTLSLALFTYGDSETTYTTKIAISDVGYVWTSSLGTLSLKYILRAKQEEYSSLQAILALKALEKPIERKAYIAPAKLNDIQVKVDLSEGTLAGLNIKNIHQQPEDASDVALRCLLGVRIYGHK